MERVNNEEMFIKETETKLRNLKERYENASKSTCSERLKGIAEKKIEDIDEFISEMSEVKINYITSMNQKTEVQMYKFQMGEMFSNFEDGMREILDAKFCRIAIKKIRNSPIKYRVIFQIKEPRENFWKEVNTKG